MELFQRIKWWKDVDRLGPEIAYTHWRLHFKSTMRRLCKRKFRHFDDTAEFRPGAYAVNCSNISLGKNVVIKPGVMLFAGPGKNGAKIIIEDNVLISPGMHIYVQNHKFSDPHIPVMDQGDSLAQSVILKQGCWVGACAVILPGVTIGENAVVGAGSIVTKSVPDYVVAAGNPARIIKER